MRTKCPKCSKDINLNCITNNGCVHCDELWAKRYNRSMAKRLRVQMEDKNDRKSIK